MNNPTDSLVYTLMNPNSSPLDRYQASVQLGLFNAPHAIDTLMHLLVTCGDWGVRHNCAWALGQMRVKKAVMHLSQVIARDDEDEQVRYVAALALIRIGTQSALDQLHTHTQDKRDAVRRAALAALAAQDDLWQSANASY